MNLPMSWLKEYVNIDFDTKTFCDKMTLSGSKVEGVENKGNEISKVVVAKVIQIDRHIDADKLFVVQADIGTECIQIVTGATNLFVGAYVPVALNGATLADGIKIKKSKLRGIESNGMFCSVEEFGFTQDDYPEAPKDGIYIFKNEQKLGTCVKELLQIDEDVVEFEITSNRADCFSVIGLAREVGATFNTPLNIPKIKVIESDETINGQINIKIENPEICKRYTCRIIKNVTIEPSPQWLRHRLTASGIRPVNNIIDITNYVMLEYGQPIQAYDLLSIKGDIIVRNALDGEKFEMDTTERELDKNISVIQNDNKIISIAGIMVDKSTVVTNKTTDILLEAINLDGTHIRLSAKKLGVRTDSSNKHEKGLDPNLTEVAINRACQLINMINCGKVLKESIDIYPVKKKKRSVNYSAKNINKLLGTNIDDTKIIELLSLLEIEADKNVAIIPTFRTDIEIEADLTEEVARLYGYDNIKPTLSTGTSTIGKLTYKQQIVEKITDIMVLSGLNQILNYSFESPKVFDKLNIEEDDELRKVITISNPLGEDFSIMRTSTLNGMLTSISTNYNRRNKEAHLFEVAKVYVPEKLPLEKLPNEREVLSIGMYGNIDFYDAKGVLENVFISLGVINNIEYKCIETLKFMHPYRTASIWHNNIEMGYIGEIHPKVSDNYSIETKVYFGTVYIDKLIEITNFDKKYKSLPKFPSMERDIAILVKEEINVADIESIIKNKGGKLLENCTLFDIYRGEQIEQGYKSVAYNISFRSNENTLTEEELNGPINKILTELNDKLQAKLR